MRTLQRGPAAFLVLVSLACSGGGDGTPAPECQAGASRACYGGPPGTAGVGACLAGTQSCAAGGTWGTCQGEVTPAAEVCANGIDEDCDGIADDSPDLDGDGFTVCDGDCCDVAGPGCPDPAAVNPGAFDYAGDGRDDDCSGTADDAPDPCDAGLASSSTDALDYARALGLCQAATAAGRSWGVLSAALLRADGSAGPSSEQRSLRTAFGSTVPREGSAFAVLSTGHAAAPGQTQPVFSAFQNGTDLGTAVAFPAAWLAANGGALPGVPGCPAPQGSTANDSVMLELRLRVPTNARSFDVAADFFSAEYPEWTCSPYNDFFLALLDSSWSGVPGNPADGNVALYSPPGGGPAWPLGVNLAHGNTGLFTVCENGNTGCASGAIAGTLDTCTGIAELAGTGFDLSATGCGTNDLVGGGTGWLRFGGNVVPGEVITLRLVLWDTSDHLFDSLVLLDELSWSPVARAPGVR